MSVADGFPALDAAQLVTRIVAHADMDAFYAAVEQRDNPELQRQTSADWLR